MRKYLLLTLFISSLYAVDEIALKKSTLEIKGKKVSHYAFEGRTTWNVGDTFNITLANDLDILSSVHFQGLPCPNTADGTPYLTTAPLSPDKTMSYSFPLRNPGTYYFVGSFGLQQQSLLTAPLIVLDPQDTRQQVVMLLEDFSFTPPELIWQNLRTHLEDRAPRQNTLTKTVLSEIAYDAYLTNKKMLENPDIIDVQIGLPIRLRIINASSMSDFFINTGNLQATVLAVDAQEVNPIQDTLFEIAPGQRLDLEIIIPQDGGAFPIFAEAQGTNQQTGLILRSPNASLPSVSSLSANPQGRQITLKNEFRYLPKNPLILKTPNRLFSLKIEGDTFHYNWSINGISWPNKASPLPVKLGDRVEITLDNQSQVLQSFSLHGHTFQITNINGTAVSGALRNTLYILPQEVITIQFDANNPGIWPLASTQLYHRWGGLMTYIMYEGFIPRYFTDEVQSAYFNRYGGR